MEKEDLQVTACNYSEDRKFISKGAKAYILLWNPGNSGDRLYILVRTKSGRWVQKWEKSERLHNFREKIVPPEHPLYNRLK